MAVAACSTSPSAAPAPSPADRDAAWRDDLHALVAALGHHPAPFTHVAEATWRHDVAALDAAIPSLDDAHVIAGMVRLAAAIGDSHTRLFPPRDTLYPLRLLSFEDGTFVAGAEPEQAWAIGKRVVAVGGRPLADATAALLPLVAADNDAFVSSQLPQLLENPAAVVGTDLAHGDRLTLTVDAGSGTRALAVVAGRGVALSPPKQKPLHLDGPTQLAYWNKYVADQRMIYLQYNACEDDKRVGPFATFADSTLAFADAHAVDRFVIDLRSNEGGDSRIAEPLIAGLVARKALAGRVFVVIGRATFSSAVINASDLATRAGAILVGTPTGGDPNGFGEITVFKLPHSHLVGQYSTKRFADRHFPGNTIAPDIAVHVSADDWFSGRDPAIDAVLAATVPATPPQRP